MRYSSTHFALSLAVLLLTACSVVDIDTDGPGEHISPDTIEDAVPRREHLSRYGNPASYAVNGVRYTVMKTNRGYIERGNASWYGKKFHGRKTSSGEVFDMYLATAAHRSLPLPTYARVTNLDNGKVILVKINDRGPFHSDRIIDLSYAAAVKIGIARAGVGFVEVRALEPGAPLAQHSPTVPVTIPAAPVAPAVGDTYIQLGAFKHLVNAREMRTRVTDAGITGISVDQGKSAAGEHLYKVRIGPLFNPAKIDALVATLRQLGIADFTLSNDY